MPFFDLSSLDPRRRRMAEQALAGDDDMAMTPGFNPDASTPVGLPPAPASRPLPAISRGVPGGMPPSAMPGPTTPPVIGEAPVKTRSHQIEDARQDYLAGTPGRFKSGALGALRGAAQGLATGGGLGAALGGALAGAGYGAINPRGQREMEFKQKVLPQLTQRFALEDADRRMRQEAEKALREDQLATANIRNTQDQIRSRQESDALAAGKDAREASKPVIANAGDAGFRPGAQPGTYEKVFEVPRVESQADRDARIAAGLTDEEGTVEEISQGSLRGRIESLKQRLTPEEQRLNFGVTTDEDDQQVIDRARAKWAKIQADELNSIRRDTGERRKAEIGRRRFGGPAKPAQRKGQPGRTAISLQEAADLLK